MRGKVDIYLSIDGKLMTEIIFEMRKDDESEDIELWEDAPEPQVKEDETSSYRLSAIAQDFGGIFGFLENSSSHKA